MKTNKIGIRIYDTKVYANDLIDGIPFYINTITIYGNGKFRYRIVHSKIYGFKYFKYDK